MLIEYNGKKYNKIKELLAETTIANIDKFLFNNEKITLNDFIGLQEKENKEDSSGSASNSGDGGSASNSEDWGSASNSGYSGSASNSGYSGSALNSGYSGSASNSGNCGSASNSGNCGSASNSGCCGSALNSGYCGSASNSGNCGSASNSGDRGSASNSGCWGISVSNALLSSVTNKAGCYSFITEFIFDNDLHIIGQNAKALKFTKKMSGRYYTLLKNKVFEVVECDNIKMCIENKTNKNGYIVYNGIMFNDVYIYKKSIKLEDLKRTIVVEKDGIFSHGETIQQAIEDFRYKIANRDASEFEYLKNSKGKIPTDEIIKAYRVITGACEFGTKQFVENLRDLKDSYTISEALKILKEKDAYGYEKFEKFVKQNKKVGGNK